MIWLGFKLYIIVTINILYKYKILLSICLAEDNVVIEQFSLDENEEESKKPFSATLKIWNNANKLEITSNWVSMLYT